MDNSAIKNSYSDPVGPTVDPGRFNYMNQAERDYVTANKLQSVKSIDKKESVIKNLAPWIIAPILGSVMINKLKHKVETEVHKGSKNLLINILRACFLKLEAFGASGRDRELWFLHMLTLASAESHLNPKAYNDTVVNYEGRKIRSRAFGLLQQTKSNWNDSIHVMRKLIPTLTALPVIQYSAKMIGSTPGHLLFPVNQYGPETPELYQISPNIGALLRIKRFIDENFHFYQGKWIALTQEISGSKNWYNITQDHKYTRILADFYAGRQLIVTLIHVNGTGFYRAKQLYHLDRLQTDPVIFNQLLNEDTKWSFLPSGDIKDPKVNSKFYRDNGDYHGGFDLRAPKGTNIYAVNDGIVTFAGWQDGKDHSKGYGRYVEIKHADGTRTRYAHLDSFNVKKNDFVKSGAKIGESDNSGHVSSGNAHLHYEIIQKGVKKDPALFTDTLYHYKRAVSPFYILLSDPSNPTANVKSISTKAIRV